RRLLREYGAGETPQALKRRGGSQARPRKAKLLERKSTTMFNKKVSAHAVLTFLMTIKIRKILYN
ncbi:hypothetical protein ACIFOT_15540, partial [Neobacillus sp. NRS-1170]